MDKQKVIRKAAEQESAFVDLLNQEMKELQDGLKQKQMIEELAKEIAKTILSCPLNQGRHCDVCKFNDKDTISYDCQSYLVAEKLLEKYQPKIPENAVVLTREEYEELDKCRWNNKKVADILLRFEEVEGRIRKETAKKFAEMAKAEAHYTVCDTRCVSVSRIDEICKEIVEGKV